MNNNCDQDDFCTCECCEEFYKEPDYNDPILRAEARRQMSRLKEILSSIDFVGAAKAIGLIFLMMLALAVFVFLITFSIKFAIALATGVVISFGLPLTGRM